MQGCLPLPGSETHLGGRTGQKDKHTKHLFAQFPEQLHMVGATLHGSCRNPFPPSLTDIKSHTTVHTVLQRRNETVKLRRSARKTQCQMRNMRHHHALIRLIIRRCLLVVKSSTKHIIMPKRAIKCFFISNLPAVKRLLRINKSSARRYYIEIRKLSLLN